MESARPRYAIRAPVGRLTSWAGRLEQTEAMEAPRQAPRVKQAAHSKKAWAEVRGCFAVRVHIRTRCSNVDLECTPGGGAGQIGRCADRLRQMICAVVKRAGSYADHLDATAIVPNARLEVER
jgi:hypothetical protein